MGPAPLGSPTHSPSEDPPGAGWLGSPQVPRLYVSRTRLLDLLDDRDDCPFVLVSAPAGSGKTSLLADWVATRAAQEWTAWVTFEAGDDAFWPGVMRCLERLDLPVSARGAPVGGGGLDPVVLRTTAAAVAAQPHVLTIVIDGYELVSAAVAGDLDFLLRHTGHRLRIVLLTRADPVLPLYRYRLAESMVEVRMSDLAFTDDEAAELIGALGVVLRPDSVRALNRRTQGWVAGLRFAAGVLRPRRDPDSAVAQVVGDNGSIAEYLMGEVLAAHTPEVREFLLATSIPDTLQPGLAEALTGRSAARMLAGLVSDNVLIERVPERPGFYRYHPFLRELLRAELAYATPLEMERLQRTAAEWFAEQGQLTAAVRHFAEIDAWSDAARQVVDTLAVGRLLLDDRSSPLTSILERIPGEADDQSSIVVRAALALHRCDIESFNDELASLDGQANARATDRRAAVALSVAVLLATRSRFSESADDALAVAERALQALDARETRAQAEAHPELAALVLASKGIAMTRQGDLDEAEADFRAGARAASDSGVEALVVECSGGLALVACWRGDLLRAQTMASRAVEIAGGAGIQTGDRSAAAQVALAWVAMDQYDVRSAAEHVRAAERSDFLLYDPVPRIMLTLVKSRLMVAQGERALALRSLGEAASGLGDRHGWLVDRLHIEAGQFRAAGGDGDAALREIEDVPAGTSEAEVALVVGMARYQLGDDQAAGTALDETSAPEAAVSTKVSGLLVECARQLRQGSSGRARAALDKSLRLAAKPGVRRPFHEAPSAVRHLLVSDAKLSREHAWLFEGTDRSSSKLPPRTHSMPAVAEVFAPFTPVESLTEKELEVLTHLADLLTTEEIAAVMYISVNTVRTHVRNILRKLGVSRRNAAVIRARELELLTA